MVQHVHWALFAALAVVFVLYAGSTMNFHSLLQSGCAAAGLSL
jgi:hypothetical protein